MQPLISPKESTQIARLIVGQDVLEAIDGILQRYNATFDTKSLPKEIYASSLLYMVYWFHRLRDPERKKSMEKSIAQYLAIDSKSPVVTSILSNDVLKECAVEFVETESIARKTVDVLIMRLGKKGREFLTLDRAFFPQGIVLPGGLLTDEDENNEAEFPLGIFAALRITAEKVFSWVHPVYTISTQWDRKYYSVLTTDGNEARIYMDTTISHGYKDHIKEITFPSDPRHLVDTTGYIVEIVDADKFEWNWFAEEVISTPYSTQKEFAFKHHKSIAAALLAKNFDSVQTLSHHEWIRNMVNSPVDQYAEIQALFTANNNDRNTSVPQLFPVVEYLRNQMNTPMIDEKCRHNVAIASLRDQMIYKLHHVTVQNGNFCPYESILRVIFETVGFFDVVARSDRNLSTHFQKKYWYRYEELMKRIPEVIIIPTFDNISATDLMKVRGVPMYFIGVSPDPIYVDEFWQSPLEFLIHDLNHAWKMMDMDDKFLAKHPHLTRDDLITQSNAFIQAYFPTIAIKKTDTEEEREFKKLKKIILFEVGHEDARPLIADIIQGALLEGEGYEFPDDVIRYDASGNQAYLEKRTIAGITALSYVRHKLQHGFFDQTDAQNIQIVSPKYRTVENIVRAAESLLEELGLPLPEAIEKEWLTAYLTRQTCSRGPSIIHAPENLDSAVHTHGDGTHI